MQKSRSTTPQKCKVLFFVLCYENSTYTVSQKTIVRVTSHNLYFSVYSQCPPPARMQVPLSNNTVNNHVTESGPLADDASFQFVDV